MANYIYPVIRDFLRIMRYYIDVIISETGINQRGINVFPETTPGTAPVKQVSNMPSLPTRPASSVISAAVLPGDKFSASIISFARFFSLPLKPALLAAIRHQVLLSTPAENRTENTSYAEITAKIRETLSFAAAAAASKGTELNPKGLETYAAAIDPDWQEKQEICEKRGGGRKQERQKKHGEQEKIIKTGGRKNQISIREFKESIIQSAENSPLLAILNRLPEKYGKRWMVFPFDFSENGKEFKVSLQILADTDNTAADCMVLDIAENTTGNMQFVLNASGGVINKLTAYIQSEIPLDNIQKYIQKLALLINIPENRVIIKNYSESFPYERSCNSELIRQVDEAV